MIGVVADDITGAGDIGIMFAKSGLRTDVYACGKQSELQAEGKADVYIIDTDSRFDDGAAAYTKVKHATKQLQELGCTAFFNKTCSVFRGNIGAEFDAMLDALQADFAVVVLGFPKNGRTTVGGIHYVHGVKLEASPFRRDPVHPMTDSDLVSILQNQTQRRVSLIDYKIIEQGADVLREEINGRRAEGGYVILDVTGQHMLAVIAEAIREERIICGASAVAEELAVLMNTGGGQAEAPRVPFRPELGILIAAGSLTQETAAQVEAYMRSGRTGFRLDPERLLEEDEREGEIVYLSNAMARIILAGEDVLLYSENRGGRVAQTKHRAAEIGLSNTQVSRLISGTIAEIIDRVLAATGQNRLVVAGGDTSAAVCSRLGVSGMRIGREIEAGLPSSYSLSAARPLMLVLKSGSFGGPDFFNKAIAHMKSEQDRL